MIIYGGATVAEPVVDLGPPRVDAPVYAAPLSWSWRSWTGDEWNLTDLGSSVIKLRGASGFGQVDPEHWWADSPTMDGSTHEGLRVGRGAPFLPLRVQGIDSNDFLVQHERFMRSLDPRREGVLRITRPDGQWREGLLRYESGADLAMERDPVAERAATYGITWATGDPYWRGETVSHLFEADTAGAFFPGPPFALGKGSSLANSSSTNPGDVDAYPVWRVNGPFTGFSVGVGAATVAVTLTKTAGQWVEIDMSPRKLTVLDEGGVDRWDNITAAEFESIPPGVEVDVTTSVTAPGSGTSVSLLYTPRYRRAW